MGARNLLFSRGPAVLRFTRSAGRSLPPGGRRIRAAAPGMARAGRRKRLGEGGVVGGGPGVDRIPHLVRPAGGPLALGGKRLTEDKVVTSTSNDPKLPISWASARRSSTRFHI